MSEVTRWQRFIENKWWRVGLLGVFALLGFGMLNSDIPDWLLSCNYDDKDGNIPFLFAQFLATLPVLFWLWVFRTYDARQQIQKTGEQVREMQSQTHYSNFMNGLEKIESDDQPTIANGVQILIEISERTKNTGDFDKQIRFAFIRRIQKLRGELGVDQQKYKDAQRKYDDPFSTGKRISIIDTEISYTKNIFKWLVAHPELGDTIQLDVSSFMYDEIWDTMVKASKNPFEKTWTVSLNQINEALDIVAQNEARQTNKGT